MSQIPALEVALLAVAGGIFAYVFFVKKPEWGLVVLFLEVILGGNGRWLELLGGTVTPRYILIVSVVAGFLVRHLVLRQSLAGPYLFLRPLVVFGLVLAVGVVIALRRGNPDPVSEPQVWLYLLSYFLIVDVYKDKGFPFRLLKVVFVSVAVMAAVTLGMMAVANLDPGRFFALYQKTPLEAMRVTVPWLQGTHLYYVFWGNSSLAGLTLCVTVFWISALKRGAEPVLSRRGLKLVSLLSVLTMVFSMTRGTWGQLVLMACLLAGSYLLRRRVPLKSVLAAVFLFALGLGAVASVAPLRRGIVVRASTLLAGESRRLDRSDSIVLKSMETRHLVRAIGARPVLGYGFGVGDYGEFGEDLKGNSRFHNFFLYFALKTGFVGLLGLLVLLGSFAYAAAMVHLKLRDAWPLSRALFIGWIFGLAGIAFASLSNPHMGTPAFVAAFALGMAFVDLAVRRPELASGGGESSSAETSCD